MILYTTFFSLVRAGLFLEPANVTQEIDWEAVYTLSAQQSMLGVVLDGVRLLPKEHQPPALLLMKWMGVVAKLEAQNDLLNQRVVELMELYRSENIPAVLLKGQGVALNYPNPRHRMCGDIDVYVGEEYFTKANNTIVALGGILGKEEGIRHLDFKWRGVIVENHRIMSIFNSYKRNKYFISWIKDWFPSQLNCIKITETTIFTPPLLFNIVYILHHASRHLMTSGLGLRQPLDWLFLIQKNNQIINKEELKEKLIFFDLYYLAQAVCHIGVHYLGFKPDELPLDLPENEKLSKVLLEDILLSGNFGQYDVRKQKKITGYWENKWYTFKGTLNRIYRLHCLMPKESWGIPLYLIKSRLKGKRG